MALESAFQKKITSWLKHNGFFYWKCAQNATTQRGVSDLFFVYKTQHGFLEVKKDDDAPYRPGQKEFLEKHSQWCLCRSVRPSNWESVKNDLLVLKSDIDKLEEAIEDGPSEEQVEEVRS